jgi:hypothetical protein
MYQFARTFFFAVALTCAFASTAFGCSCIARTTLREHFLHAEHVVVGNVIATTEVNSRLSTPGWGGVAASFQLIEAVKGHDRRPTQVVTGHGSGDCGVPMSVGTSYVFFISTEGEVDICSGTRPYVKGNDQLEEYLREVRKIASSRRTP